MTFDMENQIIPWQGVYFFTNTVLQNHRNIYTVVLKNNTLVKKIHTLVKENTPCCHKIRQECGFTQKVAFFYISLCTCFLPHCCVNIGREVRLIILPNTYKEIYDTHTSCIALMFQKAVVTLLHFWGSTCRKKRLAGRSFFQNLGSQGPGA